MKFNVHAGHNKKATGASGLLNEVTENRKVKTEVIRLLKANGQTVYDCTDDVGNTPEKVLSNIVKKCNAHNVDYDVSLHLNSGRNDKKGDGKTGGVEVLIHSDNSKAKAVAVRVAANVSKELGITNRGVKIRPDLYVLRKTNAPALLVECCFVDDKDDYSKWNANKCAKGIVEGLLNKSVSTSTSKPSQNSSTSSSNKSFTVKVANVSKGSKLNIRASASASSKITGTLAWNDPNKYTIVETKKNGSTEWGKLKSGVGWISLAYTKRV